MINAKNLSFGYNSNEILFHNISFDVGENDRVAIIGDNGSGKTSLLKVIAGVETSYVGTVELKTKNISFIPTNLNNYLLPWYSINENISFFKSKGKKIKDPISAECLLLVEMLMPKYIDKSFLGKKIYEISSGQKAMLSIICSLVSSPKILIIDETFSNLSIANTDLVIEYLSTQKITIVFTSHSERVIEKFCTKKLSLNSD